jgi:DNA-binding LacI/PurR family transcriptional regulator
MITNQHFGEIRVQKHEPPHIQISNSVRELISSGKLAPGERIPSTRELAALSETHVPVVHAALTILAKEGLIVRLPGNGTFVREREEKLTCVGVYCTTNIAGSTYVHTVREALSRELHEAGIEMDLWMDPRSLDRFDEPWKPLVEAAENRRFQAFIATETATPLLRWQRKLPVPAAFLDAPPSVPNSVVSDMRQFVEVGLRELARQGCRSVGLISPVLTTPDPADPECFATVFDMLGHFTDVASDLGLTVKNDWLRVVREPSYAALEIQAQERFGYDQFLKLWSQPEKPEGLLVFHDVIARGTLMAIQEKQVNVPRDLKLALHKNESINLFCPMPATFVVSSERESARALIEQVQKQFRGESCERISLPFKIVAHE